MDTEKIMKEFEAVCETGYIKHSGMQVTQVAEGHAEGAIAIAPHHLNPAGALHGGLVFALMDTIGGFAAKTLGVLPTTLSSTINYLRPTIGTKTLTAKADVLKRGRNVTVVRIDLYSEKDVLLAVGEANYCDLSGRVKDERTITLNV